MLTHQSSIAALYTEELKGLRRHVARKLGNPSEAEDIVQEAYMRMLTIPAGHTALRNAKAFLFTVASNLTVDTIRRDRRLRRLLPGLNDSPSALDEDRMNVTCPVSSIEDQVDACMRMNCVVRALGELPAACRRAFIMHKFHSLSYAEVARKMGVTISMVEKHLIRALAHLRESRGREASN
jgi:RNA polymerase sigma factor (sigma-70 family)